MLPLSSLLMSTGSFLVILFSLFAGTYGYAQASLRTQVSAEDSLLGIIKKHPNDDSLKMQLFHQLSEANFFNHPGRGMKYAKQALRLSQSRRDTASMHRAYNNMGACYAGLGYYLEAINCFQVTAKLGEQIDYPGGILAAWGNIADVYIYQGDYRNALKYLKRALRQTSRLSQHPFDRYILASTLASMGRVYIKLDSLPKAVNSFNQAKAIYLQINETGFVGETLAGLAEVKIKYHRNQEAISLLKQSLAYLPDTLSYQLGDVSSSDVCLLLAKAYLGNDEPDQALIWGRKANQIAVTADYQNGLAQSLDFLSTVYEAQNRPTLALTYYKAFKHVSDSLFNARKDRQQTELQLVFETERNEREISTLRKENQIQGLLVQRQRMTVTGAGISLLMLSTIVGLFFVRYRTKQRLNQQLTAQKEEIIRQKQVIEQALSDKELLMREIHHRVKNNLQIILSLLDTQIEQLDDKSARAALQESQHRVEAISLIHQHLYRSGNSTELNVQTYLQMLTTYLSTSMGQTCQVRFRLNLTPMLIDVDTAVPLGLIVNEVVTNSLKYAFPHPGQSGLICITLHKDSLTETMTLVIADNGVGLPDGWSTLRTDSMGMRLIYGLSDQLEGQATFLNQGGCLFTLQLPVPSLSITKRADAYALV